jgi:hypothetical protein
VRAPWSWGRRPLVLPPSATGSGAGDPLCLVHLVRKANGLDVLRGFADALRRHPAGVEHELVLAMKGFASAAEAEPYLHEVADLAPRALLFEDRGFDLGVYFETAARLRSDRYCFVNSFSRPLVDGWLAKLDAALKRSGVGQVGATGAWASGHSWVTYSMGLPSAYSGLMPARPVARRLFADAEHEQKGMKGGSSSEVSGARREMLLQLPEVLLAFEPFPARFVRTNVFAITHAALTELQLFEIRNKTDTYALEGSRASITRQLERIGCASLVVDRDGTAYGPEDWHRSRTLWQGDQEGLLVADNQTLPYTHGDFARRHLLSVLAWGPLADPDMPIAHPAAQELA